MGKTVLFIGIGGGFGSICRYLLGQFIQTRSTIHFPFGTLTVNIIGCFLIGVVFGLSEKGIVNDEWRLFLATGILGGFTTFSAFSNETVGLMRTGQFASALAYISASVVIGLLATYIGPFANKLV